MLSTIAWLRLLVFESYGTQEERIPIWTVLPRFEYLEEVPENLQPWWGVKGKSAKKYIERNSSKQNVKRRWMP